MKLTNAIKFRYQKLLKASGVYFALVFTIFLVGIIASFVYKKDTVSNFNYLSDFSDYTFYTTAILAFFFGICSYKTELKYFLQNGVSRRSIHLSFIASLFVNVITVLVNVALVAIVKAIAKASDKTSLKPSSFLTIMLVCCTFMCIGYFVSAFMYSVKPLNQIITVGVIILLFMLFVLIWHVKLQGSLIVLLLALYSFLFGSLTGFIYLGHLAAALTCIIVLTLSLSHIITLKAAVKK